jgi:hypothetical protein
MVAYIQCAAIGSCVGIKPVLRGMDSQFNFAVAQERCFAPEEGWTQHRKQQVIHLKRKAAQLGLQIIEVAAAA